MTTWKGDPVTPVLGPVLRRLLRGPVYLYRWRLGWVLGRRFLLLTHVGRRSGRRYDTVLEVLGTQSATREVFVMAGFGRSTDWYRNLRSGTLATVTIGGRRFPASYREVDEPEAIAVLTAYERRNRLLAPVIRRVLSALVGWRFDDTDAARARLARELPVISFRPRDVANSS